MMLMADQAAGAPTAEAPDASSSQDVLFDSQMLFQGKGTPIDTSRFQQLGYVAPGKYLLMCW